MNGPQSNFCHVCGKPLTGEAQRNVSDYSEQVQQLLADNPKAQIAFLELMKALKSE